MLDLAESDRAARTTRLSRPQSAGGVRFGRMHRPWDCGRSRNRAPCYHEPMRVTVLGSGTSHGVPMIGCDCEVCTSADPHDKRTRPSIVVALERGLSWSIPRPNCACRPSPTICGRVDAVLFTHTHADHTHGIDDLRTYNAAPGRGAPALRQPRQHGRYPPPLLAISSRRTRRSAAVSPCSTCTPSRAVRGAGPHRRALSRCCTARCRSTATASGASPT